MRPVYIAALVITLTFAGAVIYLKPVIPFDRKLVSKDGKEFSGTIIGKQGAKLTLLGTTDNRRFETSTDKLGLKDRLILRFVADRAPPPPPPPKAKEKLKDPYILRRQEEIARLRKKIDVLNISIRSNTLDPTLAKYRGDQVMKMEKEIRGLQAAIDTYKVRKGK